MTARGRNYTILAVVVGLLAAVEFGLNAMRGPESVVEIINGGTEPVENLVVMWRGGRWLVGRVEPEATARVVISGRGGGTLGLSYRQKGNALGAFELPGYDPSQQAAEGFKQVLRIRTNAVERYQDDGEAPSVRGWFAQGLLHRLMGEHYDETQPQ